MYNSSFSEKSNFLCYIACEMFHFQSIFYISQMEKLVENAASKTQDLCFMGKIL